MEILTLHLRDGLSHHPIRDDTYTCITQNKFSYLSNKLFFLISKTYLQTLPKESHNPLLIRTQTWDRLH